MIKFNIVNAFLDSVTFYLSKKYLLDEAEFDCVACQRREDEYEIEHDCFQDVKLLLNLDSALFTLYRSNINLVKGKMECLLMGSDVTLTEFVEFWRENPLRKLWKMGYNEDMMVTLLAKLSLENIK